MKTPYLPQSYKNAAAHQSGVNLTDAQSEQHTGHNANAQPHHLTPTEYIIEALGEGIKQNFLGYNIDMEFLTLSARSLAATSISAIKQHIIKPIAARRYRHNNDHSLTPTSF